jgi:hypothetical protein
VLLVVIVNVNRVAMLAPRIFPVRHLCLVELSAVINSLRKMRVQIAARGQRLLNTSLVIIKHALRGLHVRRQWAIGIAHGLVRGVMTTLSRSVAGPYLCGLLVCRG